MLEKWYLQNTIKDFRKQLIREGCIDQLEESGKQVAMSAPASAAENDNISYVSSDQPQKPVKKQQHRLQKSTMQITVLLSFGAQKRKLFIYSQRTGRSRGKIKRHRNRMIRRWSRKVPWWLWRRMWTRYRYSYEEDFRTVRFRKWLKDLRYWRFTMIWWWRYCTYWRERWFLRTSFAMNQKIHLMDSCGILDSSSVIRYVCTWQLYTDRWSYWLLCTVHSA